MRGYAIRRPPGALPFAFDVCPAVNSKFRPLQLLSHSSRDFPASTMPPKEKSKASGSTEKKSVPKPAAAKPVEEEVAATREGRTSKPDQATYQAEQDRLKKEIDEVTAKFVCPRSFICQRKACSRHTPPTGRMLSRRGLMAPREVPGTNEEMS